MSKQAFTRMGDDKYEIQRLRLLLEGMQRNKRMRGVIVEMEPTDRGFRIIVTAPTDADEQHLIGAIGREMCALSRGAMNFARERERIAVDGGRVESPEAVQPGKPAITDDDTTSAVGSLPPQDGETR